MRATTAAGRRLFFSVKVHKIKLIFQSHDCRQLILTKNLLSVSDLGRHLARGSSPPLPPTKPAPDKMLSVLNTLKMQTWHRATSQQSPSAQRAPDTSRHRLQHFVQPFGASLFTHQNSNTITTCTENIIIPLVYHHWPI